MIKSGPFHAVEDLLDGGIGGALQIGILDPQDELTAVPARLQPAEQRGPQPTDVQKAGGTWCEPGADHHEPVSECLGGREV